MANELTNILKTIKDSADGDEISFGEINEALKRRGFGALLIAPALITILPTGAIPGIPAICAVLIILIAGQAVFGRTHPWIPKKLENMSFNREKYKRAIEKAKPYTDWIDQFFHPRFEFLTRRPAQRIIAILCVLLSFGIIILGFIPFAAMLPALTVLLFGLSLSVKDGLLTAIGFALMSITVVAIPFII